MKNNNSNSIRVTRQKILQNATAVPSDSAQTFTVANPIQSGAVRYIGLQLAGTATTQLCAADNFVGAIGRLKVVLSGTTVFDWNSLGNVNTSTFVSRLTQAVIDAGGFVTSAGSATAVDDSLWIPVGANLTGNSNQVEVTVGYIAAAGTFTGNLSIWAEYGPLAGTTIVAPGTTVSMPAGSQQQIVARVPSIAGAVCMGAWIQSTTQSDDMVDAYAPAVGDYSIPTTLIRQGLNGRLQDAYRYYDGATLSVSDGAGSGQVFFPLPGLDVSSGSVVFNVQATTAENYSVQPLLYIPGAGSGEDQPRQTIARKVGSAETVSERSE